MTRAPSTATRTTTAPSPEAADRPPDGPAVRPAWSRPRGLHDARVVPAAAATWAAAWWAVGVPAADSRAAALVVVGAGVLGLLLHPLLARQRGRWRRVGAGLAGVLVLGCACAAAALSLVSWQVERRAPAAVQEVADRAGTIDVRLEVAGDPVTGAGDQAWQQQQVRLRVVLQVVDPDGPAAARVRVPASLTGGPEWAAARWGERVDVAVALEAAPAGAAYAVFARPVGAVSAVAEPAWWWQAAARLRGGLLVAAGADGTADGPGLLPGLVVGDTRGQPPDLVDDMRAAGLSHLTAVSGANVTIVCGGVLLLALLLRLDRRVAVALAAVALVGLVVVARPEPSVVRAAAMGSVTLAGLLVGRRGGGVSAVALAVTVVLLVDPWLSRAPGFRLSVMATTALVLCSMPWARAAGRVLPRTVAVALSVPAAAQVAVTPALVGLDPALSLYALPANVLAAPAVAPATVVGVVAALVSLLDPATAAVLALPAVWCAEWIAVVARTMAGLPGAVVPWPGGTGGVVLAAAGGLGVVGCAALALRALPDRREPGQVWAPWPDLRTGAVTLLSPAGVGHGRAPRRAALAILTVAGLSVALLVSVPAGQSWPGDDWVVAVCDVGQGESVLVRAGPDSAVLVDTGPEPALLADCLDRAEVAVVELLVLTHLHADHVGGLDGLVGAEVRRVWAPGVGMPSQAMASLQRWAVGHGVTLEHPVAGQSARLSGVEVDVLAPVGPAAGAGEVRTVPDPDSQQVNDSGLVVRLGTSTVSLLAVGDIGAPVQGRLLRDRAALRADVTTVAHHGAADQLPAFYAAIGARLAIASAGRDNDYGHPSPRAVDVVTSVGTTVLSTATHGGVAVRPAGTAGTAAADSPTLGVRTTRASPRRLRQVAARPRRVRAVAPPGRCCPARVPR